MVKHTLINYGDIKNSSEMTSTKRRWAVRVLSFLKQRYKINGRSFQEKIITQYVGVRISGASLNEILIKRIRLDCVAHISRWPKQLAVITWICVSIVYATGAQC